MRTGKRRMRRHTTRRGAYLQRYTKFFFPPPVSPVQRLSKPQTLRGETLACSQTRVYASDSCHKWVASGATEPAGYSRMLSPSSVPRHAYAFLVPRSGEGSGQLHTLICDTPLVHTIRFPTRGGRSFGSWKYHQSVFLGVQDLGNRELVAHSLLVAL